MPSLGRVSKQDLILIKSGIKRKKGPLTARGKAVLRRVKKKKIVMGCWS